MANPGLTDFQRELLETFFSLPEASGFVIAGGAGLLATGLSKRPTQDVDLFIGDAAVGVRSADAALKDACRERGWIVEPIRESDTFCRLAVSGPEGEVLVDLAVDSPPVDPPKMTSVGPVYAPHELAARKLLALFARAEARDFVDLHGLAYQLDVEQIVQLANQIDGGFDLEVLADMLGSHVRFADDDFSELGSDPGQLRAFVEQWRAELVNRGI